MVLRGGRGILRASAWDHDGQIGGLLDDDDDDDDDDLITRRP